MTLPSLMVFSVSAAHLTEAEAEGRQLQLPVQNVSLVITYTGMVVAALMFAGFLYVSLNFGRRRSGYGYNYDQDYYQDYASYSRRSPGKFLIFWRQFFILFFQSCQPCQIYWNICTSMTRMRKERKHRRCDVRSRNGQK